MSSKFSSLLKKTLAVAAAAAWLIVPAVLPNQQTMVYAAEARAVSQNVLANTENGQVRGFAKGGGLRFEGLGADFGGARAGGDFGRAIRRLHAAAGARIHRHRALVARFARFGAGNRLGAFA